jgi:signal transduction histidine kinase
MLDAMSSVAGWWSRARGLPVDIAIAAVLAASVGTWSLYVLAVARPGWWPVLGAAAVVAHVAVVLRRASPLLSFGAVSLACGAMAVTGGPLLLPSLAVFALAVYSYCGWGPRPAPAISASGGVVGAAVVTVHYALDVPLARAGLPPTFLLAFLLAVVLAAWSLGLFRRVQLAYIAALEERAARAETEREERARLAVLDERARMAREMHDVVAHSLAVIVSQAQGGLAVAGTDPGRAARALGTIAEAGRQALNDMRGLLGVLRSDPAPWDPQPTLRELPQLLDGVRRSGLTVRYIETGAAHELARAAELALYRLVQEALTNTIKHAGPHAHVEVRLDWTGDEVEVTVSDDGQVAAAPAGGTAGHGLVGMRERVAVVGGSITAAPGPSGGFVVRARLPSASRAEPAG